MQGITGQAAEHTTFWGTLSHGASWSTRFQIQVDHRIRGFSICGWPQPRKNLENQRNKWFISLKTRAKWERAVTWWNPAVTMRSVFYSSPLSPIPTLPRKLATILLLAFSLFELVAALSQCLCSESPCGGHHSLAHPPSQDILSSIHHNLINRDSSCECQWELKSGVSVWRRMYTADVLCSAQYTLLLLYLMLIVSNLSIKLYHIYACYMNITLYIMFGIICAFL
jgi:hypothetical protein